MEKLKVFAISGDKDIRYRLKNLLDTDDVVIVGYGDAALSSVQKAEGLSPHVIVIYHEGPSALEIAQRLYQGVPGCAIVLITERLSMEVTREALSAGIRLVCSFEEDEGLILDTVRRAGALERTRAGAAQKGSDFHSRVISVYSPKGGTGRTTIAVNLAAAMASMGKKAAIVDLNLSCACVGLFLDVQSKDTIDVLAQERGMLSMDVVRSFTVQHYSGLTVLAGPGNPENAEYVEARHVENAISVMRPFFDCIIIDLPSDFAETTMCAMENSNTILITMQPDIASIKAAHVASRILGSLQQQEKLCYVFNKSGKRLFLSLKDAAKALGAEPRFVLPDDRALADRCQCIGRPIVLEAPRTPLGRGLFAMAGEVLKG